jgi:integrase
MEAQLARRSKLEPSNFRSLEPGKWAWEEGVGFRRNAAGRGGSWYIKYRAPISGKFQGEVRVPTKQVIERLPNCRNRSQAQGVLMARKAAIFEGTYQPRRKVVPVKVTDFVPRFLRAKRHLRTVSQYRQQLEKHIIPFFGNRPLEAITTSDCLEFYNSQLDRGAACATANAYMACLKSLFSEAISAGVCQANPAKGVRLHNPNNARDRLLSTEETGRLFAAANELTDYVRPLFYTLYHTGMRVGEALTLEWADIQPDHSRIVIRDSKSGEGRKVPMRAVLVDELVRWKPATSGSRWVFPGRHDRSKPMNSIRRGWVRLCDTAQISDFTPHDLRHNFTSILQAEGVSDSIIMSITGHKTHVMLHRYSHSTDALRLSAVENLPSPQLPDAATVVPIKRR